MLLYIIPHLKEAALRGLQLHCQNPVPGVLVLAGGGGLIKEALIMAVCLDRFSQGLPDPAETEIMASCAGCGCEIYADEYVYYVDDGEILHADSECLFKYFEPEIIPVEEALQRLNPFRE